jgi:hypothetical protein
MYKGTKEVNGQATVISDSSSFEGIIFDKLTTKERFLTTDMNTENN